MSDGMKTIVHDKYLLVDIKGERLPEKEMETLFKNAVEQAKSSDLNIIFNIEPPVKQSVSIPSICQYTDFLLWSAFFNKVALIVPPEIDQEKLEFLQTASQNRGVKLKVFSSMSEAIGWISS